MRTKAATLQMINKILDVSFRVKVIILPARFVDIISRNSHLSSNKKNQRKVSQKEF